MKKILSIGFLLWMIQVKAQDTPIQQEVNDMQGRFFKTSLFNLKPVATTGKYDFKEYLKEFTVLDINKKDLLNIVNNKSHALEIDIPFDHTVVTLQLIRNKTISTETSFKTASGKEYRASVGVGYYGVIKNQKNTLVALTFFENNIMGFISNRNGNYSLGKIGSMNLAETKYILYNDKALVSLIKPSCTVIEDKSNSGNNSNSSSVTGTPNKCLKVYIVTDYKIFQKFGGVAADVKTYVAGLFQMVKTVYQNESINVYYDDANVLVWDVNDPYGGTLGNFSSQMAAGFSGDIAHLLSGYVGGGSAYLNTLCAPASIRTAITPYIAAAVPGWMFPQTYEAKAMAHEMGHNIGSHHTHACVWNNNCTPIDGCDTPVDGYYMGCDTCVKPIVIPPIPNAGGTIMSYCDTRSGVGVILANGFGIQPGNLIRLKIANASCLGNCDTECQSNVTISGTAYPDNYYNNPLTESSTWIKTNGITKILGGSVKLDANGANYVELNPGFEATYDYASTNSVFIAQAHDGCTTGSPSFTFKQNNYNFREGEGNLNYVEDNKKENSFTIYPNPATDYFILESSSEIKKAKIEIFDMNGRLQHVPMQTNTKNSKKIRINNLSRGVYLVKFTLMGKADFTKIIIQ